MIPGKTPEENFKIMTEEMGFPPEQAAMIIAIETGERPHGDVILPEDDPVPPRRPTSPSRPGDNNGQ